MPLQLLRPPFEKSSRASPDLTNFKGGLSFIDRLESRFL